MMPGGIIWRASNWLAQGDNAFNAALFILLPPLVAIVGIGFF